MENLFETIFMVVSAIISLHALYLAVFRTYKAVDKKKTSERYLFPNIIYLLLLIAAFIPVVNLSITIIFYFLTLIDDGDNWVVDHWLFKKPGQHEA